MGSWETEKSKKRRGRSAAPAESLGQWATRLGFAPAVAVAISERSLKPTDFGKLKSFREAASARDITSQIRSSWRLEQVKVTRQGQLVGLPALTAVSGGTRSSVPPVLNPSSGGGKPGAQGGRRPPTKAGAARREEVKTNQTLSTELAKAQEKVEELTSQLRSKSNYESSDFISHTHTLGLPTWARPLPNS